MVTGGAAKEALLALTTVFDIKHVTGSAGGATTLVPSERVVLVVPPSSSTHTVNLPKAQECPGALFYVHSDGNATGTITVKDGSAAATQIGSGALSADGDFVVALSIGHAYVLLAEKVAGTYN